jgi:hypothetical protein
VFAAIAFNSQRRRSHLSKILEEFMRTKTKKISSAPTEIEMAIALNFALKIIGSRIRKGSTGQLIEWLIDPFSPTINDLFKKAAEKVRDFWEDEETSEVLIERAREHLVLIGPVKAKKIQEYQVILINRYSKGKVVG